MDDELHEIMFWPWGVIIGVAVTVLYWKLRHRIQHPMSLRVAASLLAGCAMAPGAFEHGGMGPRLIYAFPVLRHFWTARWDPLTVSVVSLPPIAVTAVIAFCVLTFVQKTEPNQRPEPTAPSDGSSA